MPTKTKRDVRSPHVYPRQRLPEPITRKGSDCTGRFKFQEVKFCDTKRDLLMDLRVKRSRPAIQKEDKEHAARAALCVPLAQRLSL